MFTTLIKYRRNVMAFEPGCGATSPMYDAELAKGYYITPIGQYTSTGSQIQQSLSDSPALWPFLFSEHPVNSPLLVH